MIILQGKVSETLNMSAVWMDVLPFTCLVVIACSFYSRKLVYILFFFFMIWVRGAGFMMFGFTSVCVVLQWSGHKHIFSSAGVQGVWAVAQRTGPIQIPAGERGQDHRHDLHTRSTQTPRPGGAGLQGIGVIEDVSTFPFMIMWYFFKDFFFFFTTTIMKYVKKHVQTFDVVHITTNENQCF